MSSLFNLGIRSLADTYLSFWQPGLPCWLRIKQVVPELVKPVHDVSALGFQPAVSGGQSGVVDIPIVPPPEVREVTRHNIGLSGGRLRIGARVFLISHTFVINRMAQVGFTDPEQVFSDGSVVGFFYDGRIFNMESVTHEDQAGQPIFWTIVGNAIEILSQQPLST